MMEFFMNLGLFADAGTLTNATTTYINAYTGSTTSFDPPDTLTPTMKTFYDTELLENHRDQLIFAQLGRKQGLPSRRGRTIEWRKWNTLPLMDAITEAVIPTGKKMGMTSINVSLAQYGEYVTVSDLLELHALDDVIAGAVEELGAASGKTHDILVRNVLKGATNILFADAFNSSGVKQTRPTSKAELIYAINTSGYTCNLTPDMVNQAVTNLKVGGAPTFSGNKYVAVVHPHVAYDLRKSSDWIEAHKYASPTEIFNGEIGELHGVRFIENVFAPVFVAPDLASDSRTLTINYASGYTGAITSVTFDGGTVTGSSLVGRWISINGVAAKITANTTSTLTFASTNFGSIADNTVIYPADYNQIGGASYATYFFGKDAFGIIDPEGGALQMIVHDKDEIGGPLNQFSTIGYKFETNGATILYPERVLRVMSTSSYSATDESNI